MKLKNLREANERLARFIPPAGSLHANYKLERMRGLMTRLGNPQDTYKVVHVAGTSGKTSTSYYLAAMLKAAGQKTGLTVSPHIDAVNERVQINQQPLAEPAFCAELGQFLEIIKNSDINPTYFELLVAFAFWEFARQQVDYAVVEVGIGGLLDATNVIRRPDKVCVITDIGLDHSDVLGKTLAEIAAQKAGIIQPGSVAFSHRQTGEVGRVLRQAARRVDTQLHELPETTDDDLPPDMPLFQRRNWQLAQAVYEFVARRDKLSLSRRQLLATASTLIPARMEIFERTGKTIVLDGAHNAQKMRALVGSMRVRFPGQKIAILLAVVKSNNYRLRTDLKPLADLSEHIIITGFSGAQDAPKISVDPDEVAAHCRQLGMTGVMVVPRPETALKQLLTRPESVLLITGSFYLMNHVRPLLPGDSLDA